MKYEVPPRFGTPEYDQWCKEAYLRYMITPEEKEVLWQALLEKVKEITVESINTGENRGSSRSAGEILLGYKGMSTQFKIWTHEGRSKMHLIKATFDQMDRRSIPDHEKRVKVEVEVYWNDQDDFNQLRLDQITKEPDKYLIVNHTFYSIGPKTGPQNGFGGRRIKFKRLEDLGFGNFLPSDTIEETTNLWYSGVIAPLWRDRLRDNAIFLPDDEGYTFDGPGVMNP